MKKDLEATGDVNRSGTTACAPIARRAIRGAIVATATGQHADRLGAAPLGM